MRRSLQSLGNSIEGFQSKMNLARFDILEVADIESKSRHIFLSETNSLSLFLNIVCHDTPEKIVGHVPSIGAKKFIDHFNCLSTEFACEVIYARNGATTMVLKINPKFPKF